MATASDAPVAAVDLGSNALRLLVARTDPPRPLLSLRETTRLASGLRKGGPLDPGRVRASLAVLADYAAAIAHHGAAWTAAVGTAALRESGDGADFAAAVRRETGLVLNIVDQRTEARLTFMGAAAGLRHKGDLAVLDIGGRSTELAMGAAGGALDVHGVPLGVVMLAEDFPSGDRPASAGAPGLARRIEEEASAAGLPARLPAGVALAGTGGTFATLAAVDLGLTAYDPALVTGHFLPLARLEALGRRLAGMGLEERRGVPGLEPARADIIVPGALLAAALVRRLGAEGITVSASGLLVGCILAGLSGEPPLALTPRGDLRTRTGREAGA